jgi:hypothetical protein
MAVKVGGYSVGARDVLSGGLTKVGGATGAVANKPFDYAAIAAESMRKSSQGMPPPAAPPPAAGAGMATILATGSPSMGAKVAAANKSKAANPKITVDPKAQWAALGAGAVSPSAAVAAASSGNFMGKGGGQGVTKELMQSSGIGGNGFSTGDIGKGGELGKLSGGGGGNILTDVFVKPLTAQGEMLAEFAKTGQVGAKGGAGYSSDPGLMLGDVGSKMKGMADELGLTPTKAIGALDTQKDLANKQYQSQVITNQRMDQSGTNALGAQKATNDTAKRESGLATASYIGDQGRLSGQAEKAATASQAHYDQNINPAYQALNTRARNNAGMAMSLQDAGNVNNSVHTGVRDLYNKEGQSQSDLYEQKARGVGRQGLADTGVLAALGSQAMAGQMGGQALTGGQLQAMQGANMGRAGQAYGRAQQQMQSLREQGMGRQMDMRTQGVDRGFNESAAQYDRGQQAQGMAASMTGQWDAANKGQDAHMAGLRGEQSGYGNNIYGAQMGHAANVHGMDTGYNQMGLDLDSARGARDTAANNQLYAPQMEAEGQKANIYANHGLGMMGLWTGLSNSVAESMKGLGEIIPG